MKKLELQNLLLPLILAAAAVACDHQTSGPAPSVSSLEPPVVCAEQVSTWVTIAGSGFSPMPYDTLTDAPKVDLPQVVITRTQDIDGAGAGASEAPVTLPDDPTDPAASHVAWTSEQQMRFEVYPDLSLVPGLYDLTVTNANGESSGFPGGLLAVPPPSVQGVVPDLTCGDQTETVTINGDFFIRWRDEEPAVSFGAGVALPVTSLSDCRTLPGDSGAEACRTATVTIPVDTLDGRPLFTHYDVVLHNPENVRCQSTEQVTHTVVPEPTLATIVPDLVCVAENANAVTLTGTGLVVIDGQTPALAIGTTTFATQADVTNPALCTPVPGPRQVVYSCTRLTATIPQGGVPVDAVPGGSLHGVVVTNPAPQGGIPLCATLDPVSLRAARPPSVAAVVEDLLCVADGPRTFEVRGTDFLEVDGVPPTVRIRDRQAAGYAPEDPLADVTNQMAIINATPSQCTPLPGTVETVRVCDTLTVQIDTTLSPGAWAAFDQGFEVLVTNPPTAACSSKPAGTLFVPPAPVLADMVPAEVCLDQRGVTVTVSNEFLTVDTDGAGTGAPAAPPTLHLPGFAGDGTCGAACYTPVSMTCAPLLALTGANEEVERCSAFDVTLAQDVGLGPVTADAWVENPQPAGCSSAPPFQFRNLPPPQITSVNPVNLCTGGGEITVTGEALAGISAQLVDPDTGAAVDPASVTVVPNPAAPPSDQATITFPSGIRADDNYQLVLSNAGGCATTYGGGAVSVTIGPTIFFVDPPVVYNQVPIRATLYVSGVTTAPVGGVEVVAPDGTRTTLDPPVTWNVASPNQITATIPAGLAACPTDAPCYDVVIGNIGGCPAVLDNGLWVEDEIRLALLTPGDTPPGPLVPRFGPAGARTSVSVLAQASPVLPDVNFLPTPRAYLFNNNLNTASLVSVSFASADRLSGIVPALPAGTIAGGDAYALIVVNPDGTIGYQADAFEAFPAPPPLIDNISPTKLEIGADEPVTIAGTNFTNAVVTLICNTGSGSVVGTPTINGTKTQIDAVVNINAETICVVRVTNSVDGTFAEWSALTATNPAGNYSPSVLFGGAPLGTGRRSPAAVVGAATRTARFLYAIGGDDGTAAGILTSVEVASLGRFGDPTSWRTLQTALPAGGRSQAYAREAGGFIYLLGGVESVASTDVPTAQILRAQILDPTKAPVVTNVDLRFDATPLTPGLTPGGWTYAVSAVMLATDASNPGGQTLPSDPVVLFAPDVPGGVEIELTWDPIPGAERYFVYRVLEVDGASGDLRLLAEVTSPTTTYTDSYYTASSSDTSELLDAQRVPLAVGALGEWHAVATLTTPRAAYGFTDIAESGCNRYWYVFGGRTDVATESNTYEVAPVDGAGNVGAFTEYTATGTLAARRELSVWHAHMGNTTATVGACSTGGGACNSDADCSGANAPPCVSSCTYYFYAGPGLAGTIGAATRRSNIRVATVFDITTGELGGFSNANAAGAQSIVAAGYAAFASGEFGYILAGDQGAGPSADILDGNISTTEPQYKNFNNSGTALPTARYRFGFTRAGAFNYLVGGEGLLGVILTDTEYNVR